MYSLPLTEDAQYHDSERIIKTGNWIHIGIVAELGIALAVFC